MVDRKDPEFLSFTDNEDINRLLNTVVSSVKDFTESQLEAIRRLTQIGSSLSAERNINRLLETIVDEARRFTNADGGTLYIVDDDERFLNFAIVQNDSLNIRMGGSAEAITWLPVPLHDREGVPNHANVSSHAALTGQIINIADVYYAEHFDFEGTRKFDSTTGYRSRSMLVVPMRNHESDIIGVLQLLNARDGTNESVISFSRDSEKLTESLASQAAIALTNNRLIADLENLFESFIKTVATAIDEKSPYTGNHGRRVVDLTMSLARKINECNEGPLKDVHLNNDELNELRIAAWLHDVGKIAIPEYVMDKSTKLEALCDRIEILKTRFEVIKRDREIAYLKSHPLPANPTGGDTEAGEFENEIEKLQEDIAFLEESNIGSEFMSDDKIEKIREIANMTWTYQDSEQHLISDEEVENLCIRRGTLTEAERKTINSHADLTHEILSQLPFPKKLKNVPIYASAHHECLDGSGYPHGLKDKEIPIQARIMAIADIFEALTAADRPYRKGNTVSGAIKILGFMVKDNHLDKDLFDLFIKEKIYLDYARRELEAWQIDEDEGART
ncbi:MAG: GAF domain-containing protein [Deltaproteobacteria bacterium]|nr:GAF domain-containing protein [Deltaproteobacteria bacterium]